MKGYLIDPFNRTIEEVEHDGSLDSIYQLIDVQCFACAAFDDQGNTAYVDDEGLFKDDQEFFYMPHYPQPLAGKGLILGCNEIGESQSPTVSLDEVRAKVIFMSPRHVRAFAKLQEAGLI